MTFVQDLEAKFSHLKNVAEDDVHALILKLEAIFNRVHVAQVSDVLKQAVSSDIHAALGHIEAVADGVRAKADLADEVIDVVTTKVDEEVEAAEADIEEPTRSRSSRRR